MRGGVGQLEDIVTNEEEKEKEDRVSESVPKRELTWWEERQYQAVK
jgi:hypothetical protein